jgi:hypothetical protein
LEFALWKTVGPLTKEGAKLHVMKALVSTVPACAAVNCRLPSEPSW